MNLQERGLRFYHVGGNEYLWVHPAEAAANAIDCTDMDDDEFLAFVQARREEAK